MQCLMYNPPRLGCNTKPAASSNRTWSRGISHDLICIHLKLNFKNWMTKHNQSLNNVLNFCAQYFSAKLSGSGGYIVFVKTVHSLNLFVLIVT
jgi:hypothetical protein